MMLLLQMNLSRLDGLYHTNVAFEFLAHNEWPRGDLHAVAFWLWSLVTSNSSLERRASVVFDSFAGMNGRNTSGDELREVCITGRYCDRFKRRKDNS